MFNKTKVMIFGSTGQIGSAIVKKLFINQQIELIKLSRYDANFEDLKQIDDIIYKTRPDIIINAAAFTDVERAEHNQKLVDKINYIAVERLAVLAKNIDALFVHFSSDYVFDGRSIQAYSELSQTCPLNYYGKSKLAGDEAIQAIGGRYLIFRCSWVYSYHQNNFLSRILTKAKLQQKLNIVDDVWGAPTSANVIAEVIDKVIYLYLEKNLNMSLSGIYNIASLGKTTWFNFAKHFFELLEKKSILKFEFEMVPMMSEDYISNVLRPKSSLLDMNKIITTFNLILPDWETDLNTWFEAYPGFFKKDFI